MCFHVCATLTLTSNAFSITVYRSIQTLFRTLPVDVIMLYSPLVAIVFSSLIFLHDEYRSTITTSSHHSSVYSTFTPDWLVSIVFTESNPYSVTYNFSMRTFTFVDDALYECIFWLDLSSLSTYRLGNRQRRAQWSRDQWRRVTQKGQSRDFKIYQVL